MKYKHLIFDFDGVLAESNDVRFEGFRLLFKNYQENQIDQLIQYAKLNSGKSRYDKIEMFYTDILNKPITDDEIRALAIQYSKLIKQKVIDTPPVKGSLEFLNQNYGKYDFAIVSGSDQKELEVVCRARGIDHFFVSILGSPDSKELNISKLLSRTRWEKKACLFIGDSINDLEAARACGIDFIGRNSGLENWELISNIVSIDNLFKLHLYLL